MEKAVDNYRCERKFFISDLTKHEVESCVKVHPAIFKEIYCQRYVNNIYFDTFNLNNYFDNVVGAYDRIKFRIRWYGELWGVIKQPVLELKIKKGLLGKKEAFPLDSFVLDRDFTIRNLIHVIDNSAISEILKLDIKSLSLTLLNRYSRKYFESADKHYRITIDNDLLYYQINHHHNNFLDKIVDISNVILELKYDHKKDENAHYITNEFPFRLTKSSKYVMGLNKVYYY